MVLLVEDIDWKEWEKRILKQGIFVDKYGHVCKQISLGKVSDFTPSGKPRDFGRTSHDPISPGSYKHYVKAPELRSRPVEKDEQEDSDWWSHLTEEAEKHGIYITPSDEDRKIIVAGMKIKDRSE
jgi:hypothetical protein